MTDIRQNKKTTIYDLAKLADASPSTVSAVMSGVWKKRRISAKTAERIINLAKEQGYALNKQASMLRSTRSKVIGMIVPKYDNRYFGSIVEQFEEMARIRGLFPIITCTRRNPRLEIEAARAMLSWQVDWLIATGASDPDKISDICAQAGTPTLNLDLPGKRSASVISDNYSGAKILVSTILQNVEKRNGKKTSLIFVGGRNSDHNTRERLRGFRDAHKEYGVEVDEENILPCGYGPEKAQLALENYLTHHQPTLPGIFVNSTISLEGVVRWLDSQGYTGQQQPPMGCFDWDPFVELLGHDIITVRQNVPAMMEAIFNLIDNEETAVQLIEIPTIQVT